MRKMVCGCGDHDVTASDLQERRAYSGVKSNHPAMTCPNCDRLFDEWNAAVEKADRLVKAGGEDASEAHVLETRQALLYATDARTALESHRASCLKKQESPGGLYSPRP